VHHTTAPDTTIRMPDGSFLKIHFVFAQEPTSTLTFTTARWTSVIRADIWLGMEELGLAQRRTRPTVVYGSESLSDVRGCAAGKQT
jgi:hypothetical protein